MATLAARGSGTPATTGTTWASVTNAVDGTAGTNPATYATLTSAVSAAVATIEVTGYGFSSTIGAGDTLNSVSVSLRHFENNTGRFASVRFQAFDGATAIGTATTCTLATAARNDVATPAVTLAQLRSSTFKIVVTITGAASTQSRVESIDYVDVTADYTVNPPAITQGAYRFYADGTESGATALAAQDTAYTADTSAGDVNLQVRTRLQSTNAVALPATDDWQLQWEKNTSGTWTSVATGFADSYGSANQTAYGQLTSLSIARGQSFTGNGALLTKAGFYLAKNASPTGTLRADLYTHTGTFGSGGLPGTLLASSSSTVDIATLGTTFGWFYFTFSGYSLTAATPYFIVVQPVTGALDVTNTVRVGFNNTTPTHAGNGAATQPGWVATTSDYCFEVHAAPSGSTVLAYNSANLTDGDATTNRLGAGSGSFVAGKVSEDGLVDDLGWTANNYTELLYSVTLKQADLAPTDTLKFRVLRNGATTGLTYTQVPSITIGAGAPADVTGTATGSVSLAGSSSGIREMAGTATGALTLAGAASGAPTTPGAAVTGVATGTLTVSGTSTGTRGTPGSATGVVTLAGVAVGTRGTPGTATGTLTLAGSSSGTRGTPGTATGALTVSGVAVGAKTVGATAAGALTLTGTATGVRDTAGTATGALTVSGAAAGLRVAAGTAAAAITLTGTAVGQRTATATATGTLELTGTAGGQKSVTATATGQITVTSSALGLVEGNAVGIGNGAITLTGAATGVRDTKATATGAITVSGLASGVRGRPGVAVGAVTLTGLATATKTVAALATGSISLGGTAVGAGVVSLVVGQWNTADVVAYQWGADEVVEWFMVTATETKTGTATGGFTLTGTADGVRGTAGDVLLEAFNDYTTAPWTLTGAATIVTGRHGNGAQVVGNTSNHADYTIPAAAESDYLTVGAAWRWTDGNTLNRDIFRFHSDTGTTIHNRVAQAGTTIIVTRLLTTMATSPVQAALTVNTWNYIEVQIRLADSPNGFVIVHFNGVQILNVTGLDTKNLGTKTAYDQVRIGGHVTGSTCQWDDLYITTGSAAAFKGDITV